MPEKNYADWSFERHQAGLPTDVPPPPGVQSYEAWYREVRGLDLRTGLPIPWEGRDHTGRTYEEFLHRTRDIDLRTGLPKEPARGMSSYFRKALSVAGTLGARLGRLGRGTGALGAGLMVIEAIKGAKELERQSKQRPELHADATARTPAERRQHPRTELAIG